MMYVNSSRDIFEFHSDILNYEEMMLYDTNAFHFDGEYSRLFWFDLLQAY